MHMIAFAAFTQLHLPNLGANLNWALQTTFILLCSWVFYLLVERPGHHIARAAGRWAKQFTTASS
jgi:peptidoglycan/LPS O-acetylase OafA/YrhL